MPDVLPVAAREVGNPVQFFILVKAHDALVHGAAALTAVRAHAFSSQWNLCSTRCTMGVNTNAADTMNTSPAYRA